MKTLTGLREAGTLPDMDRRTAVILLAQEHARQDPKFRQWLANEVKGALEYMIEVLEARESGMGYPT